MAGRLRPDPAGDLFVLPCFFLAFYLRGGLHTMPEFLERRCNSACRYLFAVCSLVLWIIAQMAVVMLAGGKAMKGMLSHVSSVLNSCSTVFTMDLYKPFFGRNKSEKNLVLETGPPAGIGTSPQSWFPELIPVVADFYWHYGRALWLHILVPILGTRSKGRLGPEVGIQLI